MLHTLVHGIIKSDAKFSDSSLIELYVHLSLDEILVYVQSDTTAGRGRRKGRGNERSTCTVCA